jgi:hypothetical protein
MGILDQYLWFSSGLLCGLLVLIALLNHRLKDFPIFFCSVGWCFVTFLVEFAIKDRSDAVWVWGNLLLNGVSLPLDIAVLYWVARDLFFQHSALTTGLKSLPRNVLGVLILLSTTIAALTPAPSQMMARRVAMRLWLAEDCTEVGLLVCLGVFAGALGISWRRLQAGIVVGWGISSAVNILAMLLLSQRGRSFMLSAQVIRNAGFTVCILVWLHYVLRPEQSRKCEVPALSATLDLGEQAEKLRLMLRRRS